MLNNNRQTLLKILSKDESMQDQKLYTAGPYWKEKAKKINYELIHKGLEDFRGYYSGVGTSYCDNVIVDLWNEELSKTNNILRHIISITPILNKIGRLVKSTQNAIVNMHQQKLKFQTALLKNNQRLKTLLEKYQIENTIGFGCVDLVTIGSKKYSNHYLELLNTMAFISEKIDFKQVVSMLEIGGGFGANVHLMLQNYKNLKKIIYLDIAPNLVAGTEYLRSLYGNSVHDYLITRNLDQIKFSNDDRVEIYCIAPWQIEKLDVTIDYFHNAHSFVEMPMEVVHNYSKYIDRILSTQGKIALVSYSDFCSGTTFNPAELKGVFKRSLNRYEFPCLINGDNNYHYFIN